MLMIVLLLSALPFGAIQKPSPCVTHHDFWEIFSNKFFESRALQVKRKEGLSSAASAIVVYNYINGEVIGKFYDKVQGCNMEDAKREAFVLGKLQNQPNVAKMELCVAHEKQVVIFIRKYYGSLSDCMNLFHQQTWLQRFIMIRELNQALIDIHKLERVHGDIKIDNIVISRDGKRCFFIDFGYSSMFGAVQYGHTTYYSSPERLRKPSDFIAKPEKDVWSWLITLGTIIYPGLLKRVKERYEKHTFLPDESFLEFFRSTISGSKDPQVQYLITCLGDWLQIDPTKRPTLVEIGNSLDLIIATEAKNHNSQSHFNKIYIW